MQTQNDFHHSSASLSLPEEPVPDRFFSAFPPNATTFVEQDRQEEKKDFSRHVSAVVSHFTSTKDGFNRLLAEIDDFVHVVNLDGLIKYSSPSVTKFLDFTQEEIVGKDSSL
jgi:transcriptional regulator with PAS, ATPase and Fis domain